MTTRRALPLALLVAALLVAGCASGTESTEEPVADSAAVSSASDTVITSPSQPSVPPPLTSLPREGEADTFPAPDLRGLPVDDVVEWAGASGLTTVDVFDDPDEVGSTSEFDPHRLILLVEDGIVVDAWFG